MLRHKRLIAAIVALVLGGAVALVLNMTSFAATAINVPVSGGVLQGTVYECVNSLNEGQAYFELFHPANGNCAGGYVQVQINPQATETVTATPTATETVTVAPSSDVFTSSQSFVAGGDVNGNGDDVPGTTCDSASLTCDAFTLILPAGNHVVSVVSVVDLSDPDVTTAATITDAAAGTITVAYSGVLPGATDTIQVTFEYSS